MLKAIERAGRTCYKSEDKITEESSIKFVTNLIALGHESVLEHQSFSVLFICDRGVSHELVRHRLASFSQESTRYCNYSKDKFDNQLTFVIPSWIPDYYECSAMASIDDHAMETIVEVSTSDPVQAAKSTWLRAMQQAEQNYNMLIQLGWKPQEARSVLPNSLKTEVAITANLREWRTIFKQRTSPAAHPQMRELMCPLLRLMQVLVPVVFDDIKI